jgi:hypothetical protein
VTTGSDILKFKIANVPYSPTSTCGIEISSISVNADGTFDFSIPSSIQTLEAMHITGEFTSDTTMTGTFKIQVCGDTIVDPVKIVTWSAEWKGP